MDENIASPLDVDLLHRIKKIVCQVQRVRRKAAFRKSFRIFGRTEKRSLLGIKKFPLENPEATQRVTGKLKAITDQAVTQAAGAVNRLSSRGDRESTGPLLRLVSLETWLIARTQDTRRGKKPIARLSFSGRKGRGGRQEGEEPPRLQVRFPGVPGQA